jgi:CBS domain containing-hemolysin-like protein
MILALWIGLALVGLFFSGFFSGAETGSYRVHPLRLKLLSEQGHTAATRLQTLLQDRAGVLAVTLIGTNIANYMTTTFTAEFLVAVISDLQEREIELYTTLVLLPIIFVFGEIVPKNWYRLEPNRLMLWSSGPLMVFDWLLRRIGAVALLKSLAHAVLRWWPGQTEPNAPLSPRREVAFLLKESVAEGAMSDQQFELVDRILLLSSVRVGAVMVPRDNIVMLPRTATRADVLRTIRKHPHTRYPVCGRDGRQVVGLLDAYEFLASGEASIVAWLRQPLRLSAQASVSATLRHMREARQTFGVVVDRWGNCIGVITVKDLVEEIVGELAAW